jgi:hypothetical protein
MAELKRIDEEFPTAEVAADGNPPKQPEGPKLVKGQEPEALGRAAEVSERMPLFSESEMGDFRSQPTSATLGPTRTLRVLGSLHLLHRAACHCTFTAEFSVFETCF